MLDSALLQRLGLSEFVAVDVETTGLSPDASEIIEFAAVHFVDGAPHDAVSQLIRPQHPIPQSITQLTGIAQDDVAFQPEEQDVLPKLLKNWLKPDAVLVGHNLPFDLGFLNAACRRYSLPEPDHQLGMDTLLLARNLLPTLYSHKLGSVAAHFGLKSKHAHHRAGHDAEVAGNVLLALLEAALARDPNVLKLLRDLAPVGVFKNVLAQLALENADRPASAPRQDEADTVMLHEASLHEAPLALDDLPVEPLDLDHVLHHFGPEGPLAQTLEKFETRKEQLQMAHAVGEALNQETFLVCEAGTGVGKSFAYLIPALLWAKRNQGPMGRVVLSTRTKTLQDQLYQKDVPLLQQALDTTWRVELLKGRQNYLCLKRFDNLLKAPKSQQDASDLMPVVGWLEHSRTGDLDEVHGLWSTTRRKVYDDPEYCVGRRCSFYDDCYSVRARQSAKTADLVIVNHALLLADLGLDGGILGDYRHLILDEAHHLERSTRQALERSISYRTFKALFDELLSQDERGQPVGLFPRAARHLPAENLNGHEQLSRLESRVQGLRGQTLSWFDALTEQALGANTDSRQGYTPRVRYVKDTFADLQKPQREVADKLGDWAEAIKTLGGVCQAEGGRDLENVGDALVSAGRNLLKACDTWTWLVGAQDDAYVYWHEPYGRSAQMVSLSAAPLDVGEPLLGLYERLRGAVLASATLSVNGSFEYFLGRVGLDRLPKQTVSAVELGQPYDHETAVHLSVPTFLPEPNASEYAEQLAEMLYDVTTYAKKHTLALFTSYKVMNQVAASLKDRDLFVVFQGQDDSRTRVLEAFRNGPKAALLLGTETFWEGVDLPGEDLEILVITKLPFPVPSDPLVVAEEERLKALDQSAFTHYSLPRTILALRQGFGRLLRTHTDRGAVILADTRVVQKRYGKAILSSLPCKANTFYTPSALLSDLKAFFANNGPGK